MWPFQSTRTFWALIVMPRSRSRSIESRYCARMSRASTAPVSSRMRSRQRRLAVVDVGDDREVADAGEVHGRSTSYRRGACVAGRRRALVAFDGLFRRQPPASVRRNRPWRTSRARRSATSPTQGAERNKAVKSELKTRVKAAVRDADRHRRRRRGRCAWPRSASTRPPPRASSTRTRPPGARAA